MGLELGELQGNAAGQCGVCRDEYERQILAVRVKAAEGSRGNTASSAFNYCVLLNQCRDLT